MAAAILLLALLLWVLGPVAGPIAAGGFVVLVAQIPFRKLVRALGRRRTLAAAIATAAISLAVFVPLSAAAVAGAAQARDAVRWVARELSPSGAAHEALQRLPPFIREAMPDLVEGAQAMLVDLAPVIAPLVPQAMASLSRFLVGVFLSIVTVFYLFVEGRALVAFLLRITPLARSDSLALLREMRAVAVGLFRGGVLVALYHGASAAAGYAIFGVPHLLLLALLTGAASLLPLVGTGLVCVPVVAGLALAGEPGRAAGLGIWCLLIVGAGDHLLRPMWSKGGMVLPRLLLFLTIFGGLQLFGPIGLLVGPVVGSLTVVALRLVAAKPA